jgi:hypothetical protein
MNEKEIKRGRQIFESIPDRHKPGWGLNILLTFNKHLKNIPTPIKELDSIINNRSRWKEAHDQSLKSEYFFLTTKNIIPSNMCFLQSLLRK